MAKINILPEILNYIINYNYKHFHKIQVNAIRYIQLLIAVCLM